MALLLNNSALSSRFRSYFQKTEGPLSLPRRGFHVEPGPREKTLLAEDPVLKRFKSHKKSVQTVKRVGDILTVVVLAGCCYEIYGKATTR